MSRYIDKDKLLDDLNWHAPSEYNAKVNEVITKQPEADVVEMNDILIVSIYDDGYMSSAAICGKKLTDHNGKQTTKHYIFDDDEVFRVWAAFCCHLDKCKALQIMNEYNVSKVIICEDCCIKIFEKQGNELCKIL